MARVLTSLALLACVLAQAGAQAFGRFGYADSIDAVGMRLDQNGFSAKSPGADTFKFHIPSATWKVVSTDEHSQTVVTTPAEGSPSKVKVDLYSPGLLIYFEKGLELELTTIGSPYLTWPDGSVTSDVPTPDVPWALVSFKNTQPPVLLAFLDGKASLMITGKPGAWQIKTEKPYRGWVKVLLPIGSQGDAANTAAALGQLGLRAAKEAKLWMRRPPKQIGFAIQPDAFGVTATWRFDGPGVLIPSAATLAPLGNYPLTILSKRRRLDSGTELGPTEITEEAELKVRFPCKRVPTGRPVTLGLRDVLPLATISAIDIQSVVELGLENLTASRDSTSHKAAEDALASFISDAAYADEPNTGLKLPYAASGAGCDLTAAHALLMQSLNASIRTSSEANSLLTSLCWRRDWATWRILCDDPVVSRRAGAIAAVAAAICSEPQRRLDGAMFEAGLAAERGLEVLKTRAKILPEEPKHIEPLDALRRALFTRNVKPADDDLFTRSLLSEVRVFGSDAVQVAKDPEGYKITWSPDNSSTGILTLAAAYPITVIKHNLANLTVVQSLGFIQLKYTAPPEGRCELVFSQPDYAKLLPENVPVPRYEEPVK